MLGPASSDGRAVAGTPAGCAAFQEVCLVHFVSLFFWAVYKSASIYLGALVAFSFWKGVCLQGVMEWKCGFLGWAVEPRINTNAHE